MPNYQIANVDFYGDTLISFHDGKRAYVACKPICERLGIDWSSQYTKLKNDPIFAASIVIITTDTGQGRREVVCIAVDMLQAWMMSINPNKVKEELREPMNRYRAICAQALSDFWTKGIAINPLVRLKGGKDPHTIRISDENQMLRLIAALKKTITMSERAVIEDSLRDCLGRLNIAVPDLSQIGNANVANTYLTAPFFELLDQLASVGAKFNHHRNPARIAVSLKEVAELALTYGLSCDLGKRTKNALRAHPRFVDDCAVNSRDGKSIHCWVFQALSVD